MSTPIKPCPFCGADAQVGGYAGKWVCCVDSECAVSGPARHTAEEAITAWNAAPRTPSAPPANTARVRVAVETNKDGFARVYWVGPQEEVDAPSEPSNRITYASFNAFLPEPAAEVQATIE